MLESCLLFHYSKLRIRQILVSKVRIKQFIFNSYGSSSSSSRNNTNNNKHFFYL